MTIHETATLGTPFGRAVYYDLDTPLRMHVHSALHALVHLGGAPAHYQFADGDETVSEGRRITLVDPWVAHADERHGRARSRVLALYIEPTLLRSLDPGSQHITADGAGWIGGVRFRERQAELTGDGTAAMHRLADHVRTRRNDDDDGARVFAAVVRMLFTDHGAWRDPSDFPGTGALDRHVRAALEFLNERKGEPFDGDALLARVDLGRSRLHARFREVVGLPPKAYADALRAEAAIGLLAADDRPVGEIADELGFTAPSHLTRFLRDYTGLTPTEHRQRARASGVRCVYLNEFE